jgi:hypothetical protein
LCYQRPAAVSINPLPRGAEEGKKSDVPTYLPTFFEIFRSDFRKYFNGVFGLLMQRNGQKRDKIFSIFALKDERKKVCFFAAFSVKSF